MFSNSQCDVVKKKFSLEDIAHRQSRGAPHHKQRYEEDNEIIG